MQFSILGKYYQLAIYLSQFQIDYQMAELQRAHEHLCLLMISRLLDLPCEICKLLGQSNYEVQPV